MKSNSSKILVAICYISAAVVLSYWSSAYRPVQVQGSFSAIFLSVRCLLLFGAPAIFAVAYARLLLDPSLKRHQRFLPIFANFSLVAAVLFYFRYAWRAGFSNREQSLTEVIILQLVMPLFFLLVTLAIFRRHALRYVLGVIAAVVLWPYLAANAFRFVVSVWGDPTSAVLLYAVVISPLVLVFAATALFYSPRVAYWTALTGAFMVLPEFIRSETLGYSFVMVNSWILFNFYDRHDSGYFLLAKLKILASALIVVSIAISVLRLLPERWSLRGSPVGARTWPAFAIGFLVLAAWYGLAVTPYRVPMIVDGAWPELSILHVEKQGSQFHETRVSVSQDGRFWIYRNNRRLFQYQFQDTLEEGSGLSASAYQLASTIIQSSKSRETASWPKPLRARNAEGWYVLAEGFGIRAYTSELGTVPPREVIEIFHDVETQKTTQTWPGFSRDVCLGFCYDPPAGLGIVYVNVRCNTDRNVTKCE
jgi:hypothetical protein